MATKKTESTWKDLDRKERERLMTRAERRAKEAAACAKRARLRADADQRAGAMHFVVSDRRRATSLEKESIGLAALADLIRRNLGEFGQVVSVKRKKKAKAG